jgi:hypothetical protein
MGGAKLASVRWPVKRYFTFALVTACSVTPPEFPSKFARAPRGPSERIVGVEEEPGAYFDFDSVSIVGPPVARIDCPGHFPDQPIVLSGLDSVDPLGLGLDYHWRVLRSPPTPQPSRMGAGPNLGEWIVIDPFGGPWEFGLRVEDARGRVSEEATCRIFHRYSARLVVELSWSQHAAAADLDIHVVQAWADLWDVPGDCHFANASDPGWSTAPDQEADDCRFDVDSLGFESENGPGERVLFYNPRRGAMDVVIHEFASGAPEADEEPVMVRIWLDNRLIYDTLEQRPPTEWWVARVDLKTNTAIRLDPPVESPE